MKKQAKKGEIPSILYLTGVSISMFACIKKTVLFNVFKKIN